MRPGDHVMLDREALQKYSNEENANRHNKRFATLINQLFEQGGVIKSVDAKFATVDFLNYLAVLVPIELLKIV